MAMSSIPALASGMTQTELAMLLRMNRTDVKAKLGNLAPIGKRASYDLYDPKEAVRALVPPPDDLIERILRMNAADLPKMLSKEFWYGQNQRLNYMERVGDLWSSKAVIDLAGEAFKTIRLSLMLIPDAVERETSLTNKQREVITMLVHSALEDMRGRLVDAFLSKREQSDGKSFIPSEVERNTTEDIGGDGSEDL